MTKKESTWYDCGTIKMIWHGAWADPELQFGDKVVNYYDVEEYVCERMTEEGLDYDDGELFGEWVRNSDNLRDIEYYIQEL